MKPAIVFAFLTFFVVSCNKDESVMEKVEGDWHYYKKLLEDGTYVSKDANYTFEENGTFSCYTPAEETMVHGEYTIAEKGTKVIFTQDSVSDTTRIEDLGKESMVLTTTTGIIFFERIKGE